MASNFSFRTLLKKPPRNSTNTNTNDLSFVKAAAWAWYQHNSGSKGKTITEFHATVTRHEPRPSRYRLEAMRTAKETPGEGSPKIHAKKASLLDEYEVQSISRQFHSLVEDSNHKPFNGADNNSTNGRTQTKKKKKEVGKGFWLRYGVVCGGEKDVVDPSGVSRNSRRGLPTKQVPAVYEVKRLTMENGAL